MRYQATVISLLVMLAMCVEAAGQSVDAARAARDKAKADLIKAQEAFHRADDAYIQALGGAATARPAAATQAPTSAGARPRIVTFSLSGPRVQMSNPLEYRARVVVDGQPGAWTEHASGAKSVVPAEARTLAYEVQNDARGDARNPEWKTICTGSLPLNNATIVDIAIAQRTTCSLR